MTEAWTIAVAGRVYGPYSLGRMRAFAEEGRLAAHSLVARAGTSEWREARDEPAFGKYFGAGVETVQTAARAEPELSPAEPDGPDGPAEAAAPASPVNGKAQLTIAAELRSRATAKLEQAILSLGPTYKVLPNVWIVSSDQTASAVRNRLVRELGKRDSLFVVDSTHGKAAWFNFGAEADTRIRRVWQRAS